MEWHLFLSCVELCFVYPRDVILFIIVLRCIGRPKSKCDDEGMMGMIGLIENIDERIFAVFWAECQCCYSYC